MKLSRAAQLQSDVGQRQLHADSLTGMDFCLQTARLRCRPCWRAACSGSSESLEFDAARLCFKQAEISALASLTYGAMAADSGTALQANAGEQPYTGGTASLEQAARTPPNPLSSLLATFGKRKLLLK